MFRDVKMKNKKLIFQNDDITVITQDNILAIEVKGKEYIIEISEFNELKNEIKEYFALKEHQEEMTDWSIADQEDERHTRNRIYELEEKLSK